MTTEAPDLLQLSADQFLDTVAELAKDKTAEGFFEEAVEAGEAALKHMDTGRFFVGELLIHIKKRYGANQIGAYAKRLRRAKSTLYEWRAMARFYQRSARAEFLNAEHKVISYDHMREAMRRADSPDEAIEFLREAVSLAMTVEEGQVELTVRKGKPRPALKVVDMQATLVRKEGKKAAIEFEDYPGLDFETGKTYRAVFYELKPYEKDQGDSHEQNH
jgi:hypothetical protein